MLYRKNPKNGDQISPLGLGCMRFPRKGNKIDQEKTNELVAAAIDKGINYFDTAYIYPGSEEALGKALAATGRRDQIKIATKLPQYMCSKPEDFDKYFNIQLARLQTDRIDYYLMHMLGNAEAWNRLKACGIVEWANRKRAEGKIKNFGFSFHGGRMAFVELLNANDWDFCMVQFNYLDENNQAGYSGVQEAHKKGLPVFVMEPLRGGLLANKLPEEAKQTFKKADKDRSLADWALRWVWDHKEVTMALSGMSDMAQLNENVGIAGGSAPGCLSAKELAAYKDAVAVLNKVIKVPCTGCGYCLPCPRGVDIPTCFSCYNQSFSSGLLEGITGYFMQTGMITAVQSDASKCIKCGKCEKHCPQSIHISDELVNVRRRMKSSIINPLMGLARKVMRIK